ncbi:MAG: hypothetical protein O7A04_06735, partial [Acidobacteria bacterium]|nr:hypothetical protein [Acidobacteriota bacterium]
MSTKGQVTWNPGEKLQDRIDEQAESWDISRAATIKVIVEHWLEWRDHPEGVDPPDRRRHPGR